MHILLRLACHGPNTRAVVLFLVALFCFWQWWADADLWCCRQWDLDELFSASDDDATQRHSQSESVVRSNWACAVCSIRRSALGPVLDGALSIISPCLSNYFDRAFSLPRLESLLSTWAFYYCPRWYDDGIWPSFCWVALRLGIPNRPRARAQASQLAFINVNERTLGDNTAATLLSSISYFCLGNIQKNRPRI